MRFSTSDLHLTFKYLKFKNMNVKEMIPASGRAADLLRSLSHPQRLLVLCALGNQEKSVAELRQELEIDQVPMSQQLMRLRADGLVEARREGTTVHYRIARPEILTVVEALHTAFCPPHSEGDRSGARAGKKPTRAGTRGDR
jgi:DNA-binding transcriptional ArsR family regulator